MRKRLVGIGLAMLALVGCGSGEWGADAPAPPPPATPSAAQEADIPNVEVPSPEAPLADGPTTRAPKIVADPGLVAAMECEPVDPGLIERGHFDIGTPTRAVQVEIGEGLAGGEIWWLVAYDMSKDDSYPARVRTWISNAPGLTEVREGEWRDGKWIEVYPTGNTPWLNVHWDAGRLARGQAALTKALECLSE